MAKNCIICNKKIGFFERVYEEKYCQECYDKQITEKERMNKLKLKKVLIEEEQKEEEKKEIKKNSKLEYIKRYLLTSYDNLDKILTIMQFPMHYSENFKEYNITMPDILFDYIEIIIDEIKEEFKLSDLEEITIERRVAKILEKTNYLFKNKFSSDFFISKQIETDRLYFERTGNNTNSINEEDYYISFSTTDNLRENTNIRINTNIELANIITDNYNKVVDKCRKSDIELDVNYKREIENELEYWIRGIYYQLALNILYLVVYSREVEKFLNHSEISQIIYTLEREVHNDDYLVEKVYELYTNLYKKEFLIEFGLQDIVNILIYNRQRKGIIRKVEKNNLIEENIEDYVFDIDIQPLMQLDSEDEIRNKIYEEIKSNIINLQEYITLKKLLNIVDSIIDNIDKTQSQINREKAKIERERILNGNFEKEKKINDNELDYSNISTGYDFETYIANLYKILGYKIINLTSKSGDQGADVIIEKNNIKYAIQVKYYSTPVGNKAVQEVVAAKNFYKTNKAMVVTNSTYTQQAKLLAKANDVILVDGGNLQQLIDEARNS